MKKSGGKMKTTLWTIFAGVCLVVSVPQSRASSICDSIAVNSVTNCGFETGDFTGWQLMGNDVPTELGFQYGVEGTDPIDGISPNSGDYQAFFADLTSNPTTLSQTITTIPGELYTVSWYLAQDTTPTVPYSNAFSASFAGDTLADLTGISAQGYTLYTDQVAATSASTTLSFTFGNDLGEFLLDDVSVVAPEPSAWTLMLLVAGGCVFLLKRKVNQGVAK
jgi:hypothetical protein